MKLNISKIFGTALLAGVAVMATPSVQAIGITGEIGIIGNFKPVASNPSDLLTATALKDFNAVVGDSSGAYSALTFGTSVTHSNFVISPFAAVEPLWTIDFGGIIYSFDLMTLQVGAGSTANELILTGTGIAKITGFNDTPGKWNLTANTEAGTAFTFSSGVASTSTSVPDGGTTLALFGLAMLGIFGLRRLAQKQA